MHAGVAIGQCPVVTLSEEELELVVVFSLKSQNWQQQKKNLIKGSTSQLQTTTRYKSCKKTHKYILWPPMQGTYARPNPNLRLRVFVSRHLCPLFVSIFALAILCPSNFKTSCRIKILDEFK